MQLRHLLVALVAFFGGACTGPTEGAAVLRPECEGLAERWGSLQQVYLDELADADVAELPDRTARVRTAGSWLGQAMIEQARDVQAAGCAASLESGSTALCVGVEKLVAHGAAGETVIDTLRSGCV